jgi:tripartite-type tricarboxylate transporter receptor subunit TctC
MKSCVAPLAMLLAVSAAHFQAHAQTYPAKQVRIISGVIAGGPGDTANRGAAQVLSQALGQPFVVENRLGAEGMIAGEACAKSAPDGYTLCMFDGHEIALNPVIRTKMTYDPGKDMTPVMHLGFAPAAILAHPSVPANTLQELFALAKAKPGSINWGSSGLASPGNLYIEWLKNERGIRFHNVPYKSAVEAMRAVLAGEIHVTSFVAGAAAPNVKAGKFKALAVAGIQRSPSLPNVPTFKEAGMDIAIITWFGMMAPSGTPRDSIQRLNSVLAKDLFANAALRDKFLTTPGIQVASPAGEPPAAFADFLKAQREMYAGIVKVTGVRIE